jgi:hypothetical protein
MEIILLCSAAAASVGAAAGYLYATRQRVPEWPELIDEQKRMAAHFANAAPRAVTKLTNRERTVIL